LEDCVFGVFAFAGVVFVVLPFIAVLPVGACVLAAPGDDVVGFGDGEALCLGGLVDPPPLPCAVTDTFVSRTRMAAAVAMLKRFMMNSPPRF
jgi:hypothetical protein